MPPPPGTKTCECDHSGMRHRDDGTCAVEGCTCRKFSQKIVRVVGSGWFPSRPDRRVKRGGSV